MIMDLKGLTELLLDLWFILALIMSLYWGIRGVVVFEKHRNYWWKSYQFIFNFVGSFAGWFFFYVLLFRVQSYLQREIDIGWVDIVLFIISLLGLTGHLPQATYGFVEGLGDIVQKMTGRRLRKH